MASLGRIGVLLAVALLVSAPAAASHCRPTEPICSDFWDAAAVFVGRVEALGPERKAAPGEFIVVTTDPFERVARFEVLEAFRGPENVRPGSMVNVGFGSSLSPGATYFIYAHEDDRGRLIIASCGRTKALAEAAEDLRFARGLATDRSTEARVFGDVTWKEQTTTAPPRDPQDRLPRVSWIAAAGGSEWRFESDAEGHIEGRLPPGRYTVRVEAPAAYIAAGTSELEILDARACRRISVATDWSDSVSGRIVDAERRPVAGLRVHMVTNFPGLFRPYDVYTDAAGGFLFPDLGAGDHDLFVGANILPKSIERKIRLVRGEHQVLDPVTLPANTPLAFIAGSVVDDKGLPIEGARVELVDGQVPSMGHFSTGADGRYRFAAVPGRAYRIEAMMFVPPPDYIETAQSEPIEAGAVAGPKPLVFRRAATP